MYLCKKYNHMGYKLLELEEVKESGRWTESGVEAPKAYKGHKHCAYCEKEFIVNQLKRGREPLYCSTNCRVKAYKKRKGVYDETHPLAMKEQGVKGINDSQLNELKEVFLKEIAALKEADNTLLEKIEVLTKEITNNKKETSSQVQKASQRTTKDGIIDFGIGAGATVTGNFLYDLFKSNENKNATRKDLFLVLKKIEQMHVRLFKALDIKINQVPDKIKKQQRVF